MICRPLMILVCSFTFTITCINTLAVSSQLFFLFKRPMKMEKSVSKRRHIKFRSRESPKRKNTTCTLLRTLMTILTFTCSNFIHYYYYYYYHHHHHYYHLFFEEYIYIYTYVCIYVYRGRPVA
jgi:hypothetical protein